jgi:hypothetical protein
MIALAPTPQRRRRDAMRGARRDEMREHLRRELREIDRSQDCPRMPCDLFL